MSEITVTKLSGNTWNLTTQRETPAVSESVVFIYYHFIKAWSSDLCQSHNVSLALFWLKSEFFTSTALMPYHCDLL